MELQDIANLFMKHLNEEISKHFGLETPFMIKFDIQLGVRPEDEEKAKLYQPILQKMLENIPKEYGAKQK